MTPARFDELIARIPSLRVAVIGDFSLDRYFDIDPERTEISIETGLPVHNVTRVRCQPGAAGNITANLAALGAGRIWPVSFCGDDGEGFELRRTLARLRGVQLDHFVTSAERHTFCYSKPLLHRTGQPPEELSRLDLKNWTPSPPALEAQFIASLRVLAPQIDALVVMDQSAAPGLGVITPAVRTALGEIARDHRDIILMADSRHGLADFPPLIFKMNAAEFKTLAENCNLLGYSFSGGTREELIAGATAFSTRNGSPVFITLAGEGMIGAVPTATAVHRPALPLRGPIDIVGAGDTVTATLALALAAGADLAEAMDLAQAAASLVIHQLGTTGTAAPRDLRALLFP